MIFYDTFLVHSTTPSGYVLIIQDGAIKSWNRVKREHKIKEGKPIGELLLGDDISLRDYVLLGGGVWNEIVVNSKEKGYICMDTDIEYTPGARFYFNIQKLTQDGLLINDGVHYKVKDELPLSYSLFCATLDNVSINGKVTPQSFADAADEVFNKFINDNT